LAGLATSIIPAMSLASNDRHGTAIALEPAQKSAG